MCSHKTRTQPAILYGVYATEIRARASVSTRTHTLIHSRNLCPNGVYITERDILKNAPYQLKLTRIWFAFGTHSFTVRRKRSMQLVEVFAKHNQQQQFIYGSQLRLKCSEHLYTESSQMCVLLYLRHSLTPTTHEKSMQQQCQQRKEERKKEQNQI